jgi:hypothetical protein
VLCPKPSGTRRAAPEGRKGLAPRRAPVTTRRATGTGPGQFPAGAWGGGGWDRGGRPPPPLLRGSGAGPDEPALLHPICPSLHARPCLPASPPPHGVCGPAAQELPRPRPDEQVLEELRARQPAVARLTPDVLGEIEARRLRRAGGRAGSGSLAEEGEGEDEGAVEGEASAASSPPPPPLSQPLAALPLNVAAHSASPELPPAAAKAALPASRLARAPPSKGPARGDKENRPASAACGGA